MQDWKVIEILDGKTKLKGSGTEKEARAAFKSSAALGTNGKIVLLDDQGVKADEFASVVDEASLTGLPMREIHAPLPASCLEAAARASAKGPLLECLVPKGQAQPEPADPEPEPEPVEPAKTTTSTWIAVAALMVVVVVGLIVLAEWNREERMQSRVEEQVERARAGACRDMAPIDGQCPRDDHKLLTTPEGPVCRCPR